MKLKARVVKNRLKKYNIVVNYQGKEMPIGRTFDLEDYRILNFETEEEAKNHVLDFQDRLELVE